MGLSPKRPWHNFFKDALWKGKVIQMIRSEKWQSLDRPLFFTKQRYFRLSNRAGRDAVSAGGKLRWPALTIAQKDRNWNNVFVSAAIRDSECKLKAITLFLPQSPSTEITDAVADSPLIDKTVYRALVICFLRPEWFSHGAGVTLSKLGRAMDEWASGRIVPVLERSVARVAWKRKRKDRRNGEETEWRCGIVGICVSILV